MTLHMGAWLLNILYYFPEIKDMNLNKAFRYVKGKLVEKIAKESHSGCYRYKQYY